MPWESAFVASWRKVIFGHSDKIVTLIVKTTTVNFSYFEISIGMGTLTHILFNDD